MRCTAVVCRHMPVIFTDAHPELRCVNRDGQVQAFIYMLKRSADGSKYLDYMLPRLIQTVKDYGLDAHEWHDMRIAWDNVALVRAYDRGMVMYVGELPSDVSTTAYRLASACPWKQVACWMEADKDAHTLVFKDNTERPLRLNSLPEWFDCFTVRVLSLRKNPDGQAVCAVSRMRARQN